jgi:predicted  nucleic acid-binding Zn-ribbon protein
MTDVVVSYQVLAELDAKLQSITAELQQAAERADVLEDAIGDPFGRNDLREAVEDFEDRWNNRRKNLAEDVADVQEHVHGVLEGFRAWDRETAAGFDGN